MKRILLAFVSCAVLLAGLPLRALAIDFDGNVLFPEWFDYPAAELFREPSLCGIASATVRFAMQPTQNRVMFGFTAVAPGVAENSPVGAAFLLGDREIGRWQQGLGTVFADAESYDLQGLAYIREDAANGGFTFEIALGYKTEAALYALRDLAVRLFDPQGTPSRVVPCPIVTAEPVTTTRPSTTERTTTTKAPTTAKPTTTKAPTTAKPTTTKAPTTAKPTTTKAPTTALPVYTAAPPAAPPAPQATTAAPSATINKAQATQPGTSRTEIFYYTAVYTDVPGAPGMAAEGQAPRTYEHTPAETSQPQSVPTLAMPAPQPAGTASSRTALLFCTVGALVLLAAALFVLWLRSGKNPGGPGKPTDSPT